MNVVSLFIENIRLIKSLKIENTDKINFILGNNAQGKSTVLESLYILSTSKSNRTFKDREFISVDENTASANADIKRIKRPDINIRLTVNKNYKKEYWTDGSKKSRINDGIGELNSVIFSSADMEMIKGDPCIRRNYLNLEISQIYPVYSREYANYKKILLQRNNILKEIKNNIRESYDILDILDIQLAFWGSKLIIRRNDFANKINKAAGEIYNEISDRKSDFRIIYQSNPKTEFYDEKSLQAFMLEQIKSKKDTDIKMGTTVTGPHRDDIEIKINNMPVKNYGSGGEIRSASFAMKMAEIDIVKEIKEEYPIVLLDDLMSELDLERRKKSIEIAGKNCQIFITTTHLDDVVFNKEISQIYYLSDGCLINNNQQK